MRKKSNNAIPIFIIIILLLFIVLYFFVPFLGIGFLQKTFSPFCTIKNLYQGEEYLPEWCIEKESQPIIEEDEVGEENTNKNVGLANPAAVKCEKDGGSLEPYTTDAGQDSLCVFTDDSICNEWAYFKGECEPGECIKECRAKGTKNEGWYNSCTGQRLKLEICGQELDEEKEPELEEEVKQINIKITTPVADQQLSSPFKVEGQAIALENKIYVRVKNTAGTVLIEETATAINKAGSEWADFDIEISYEFDLTKEGTIEVYSLAQDDAEMNLVTIPVKF
ncbi:Gmad2 immunoglobulin-like domain-containing protein [Patescibacteria group bacterium]